jgi:RHS repeat-associated protein
VYGTNVDEPIVLADSGAAYFYHADALGSVVALTNQAGAVQETYSYGPYGEVSGASAVGNPYLYTARHYDSETSLYYYRARYYDPRLGRFLQSDPVGYAEHPNLYTYCANNPVNFIDPFGLSKGAAALDWLQGGLDVIGVLDPFGVADGLNALIYLGRGMPGYASLSVLGMVPYIGDLGKAGKYGGKALKYSDDAAALIDLAKHAKRTGVSLEDGETLLKWADEYKVRPARGPESHLDRTVDWPHFHIGPVEHIPLDW